MSSPRTLVLHGLEATGKTLTIKAVLEALGARHVIVNSRECITARHLLECTVTACKKSIEETGVLDKFRQIDGRCESLSALAVQLQRLLEDRGKFILVFDAIDKQRDAPPTLLSGIGRLGEIVSPHTKLIFKMAYGSLDTQSLCCRDCHRSTTTVSASRWRTTHPFQPLQSSRVS